MSEPSNTDPTVEPEALLRAQTHLEQALELCDDDETQYFLREALHLLATPDTTDT